MISISIKSTGMISTETITICLVELRSHNHQLIFEEYVKYSLFIKRASNLLFSCTSQMKIFVLISGLSSSERREPLGYILFERLMVNDELSIFTALLLFPEEFKRESRLRNACENLIRRICYRRHISIVSFAFFAFSTDTRHSEAHKSQSLVYNQ